MITRDDLELVVRLAVSAPTMCAPVTESEQQALLRLGAELEHAKSLGTDVEVVWARTSQRKAGAREQRS